MLSRPPASLAARDQPRPACSQRRARRVRIGCELRPRRPSTVSPSRAEQEDVAAARRVASRVDLDVGLGPERARDDRALRVRLGLLLGELARAHELLDERVVAREPLSSPSRSR